jgi:hypothetical protein
MALPNAVSLDLSHVPNLADHLLHFILDKLQAGLEWKLHALVFPYSGLTEQGLHGLESVLRITSGLLKYIVVSGMLL